MNANQAQVISTIEIVIRETANAHSVSSSSVQLKRCDDKVLATVVGILDTMGIESPPIAAYFKEDSIWVRDLKTRSSSFQGTSVYEQARHNSDAALLMESLELEGAPETNGAVSSHGGQDLQLQQRVVVAPVSSVARSEVCTAVLTNAEDYFGIKEDGIINPTNEDDKDAQNKCVKAMSMCGATHEQIRDIFNAPDNEWVDSCCALVADDDGDLECIKVEVAPQPSRSKEIPDHPAPGTDLPELTEEMKKRLDVIARLLQIDIELLRIGTDRVTSKKRQYAACILKSINIPEKVIAATFGLSTVWANAAGRTFNEYDRGEVTRFNNLFHTAMLNGAQAQTSQIVTVTSVPASLKPMEVTRPPVEIELQSEAPPSSDTWEQISARVFAALVPPNILFAPNRDTVLAEAAQALIFVAAGSLSVDEIAKAVGISQEKVFQMVGEMHFKIRADASLAKKIKAIQRN